MINMTVVPCAARRNLECGDKSRAVRGSRHRFLSIAHLVKRRAVSRERGRPRPQQRVLRFLVLAADLRKYFFGALPGLRVLPVLRVLRGGTSVCSSAGKQTLAPPGAPRARVPHAFIARRFACMGGPAHETRARCPCHASASLRLCVKKLSTLNFLRAGTPALPTARTQNTRSPRRPAVATRLRVAVLVALFGLSRMAMATDAAAVTNALAEPLQAADAAAVTNVPAEPLQEAEIATADAVALPTEPKMPVGDPFAMRGLAEGDGFVSAGPAAIPPGIRVVAILAVAGKPPVGALEIPGSTSLHFVREGDVIQVDRPEESEAKDAVGSQLYLLVKSITKSQIEIAPRTRPHDVRIYR